VFFISVTHADRLHQHRMQRPDRRAQPGAAHAQLNKDMPKQQRRSGVKCNVEDVIGQGI